MVDVRPFRALRPKADLVKLIAALPYDVVDRQEARKFIEDNPLSFLRVTRPEATLPDNVAETDPQVYATAKANLEAYVENGQLVQDSVPYYYIYRQQMGAYIQIGLVATASVEEYAENIIKKHELTREDKELDRIKHITATQAQTGPIFLAYKSKGLLTALLLKYMSNHKPVYDFTADDGIMHTLYVVNDPVRIKEITDIFSHDVPNLYIADGHHRSAAALKVAQELSQRPGQTGQEEYKRFLAVIFPDNMLHILAYNRVVKDLNGLTTEEFRQKVEEKFIVSPLDNDPTPQVAHTFAMYLAHKWYRLAAKEGTFDQEDPINSLDVSILQNNLLTPILGINDPRRDKRISFVGGIKGLKALEKKVNDGKYAVAFAMYPTSMEELMAVADSNRIMPPKSTWFEPKLRDAMTIHLIGDEQDDKSV